MIQSVEIIIKSGIRQIMNALVIFPKNICYINGQKKVQISDTFKDELVKTICLWKNEYGSDNNIDSEEFMIIVTAEDETTTFHGKGIYPTNYHELIELLGDVNG